MQLVTIWTDGACERNPGGRGGWAALVQIEKYPITEISGAVPVTTNNKMEMTAAIKGLKALTLHSFVTLYSDSQYLINGMTKWIHSWLKQNWITSGNNPHPVKNRELWEELWELSTQHQIIWKWVRGHNGQAQNERCDQLATEAIKRLPPSGI